MPNIWDSLDDIGGFQLSAVVYLIMEYYDMMLDGDIHKLYTIVIPWEKYVYQCLSMVVLIALNVFQEKRIIMSQDVVHICVYMDVTAYDLVIISSIIFRNDMDILDEILNILEKPVIQNNSVNIKWAYNSGIYLVFVITWGRIKPHPSKIKINHGKLTPPPQNDGSYISLGWLIYIVTYGRNNHICWLP